MTAWLDRSISDVGQALRSGDVTAEQLTDAALKRIALRDPHVHAFITVTAERALDDARRADREIAQGIDKGPLHGVPYALKDIYDTAGIRTTCHSRLKADHVPSEDSFAEAKLRAGGAVLLGKLSTYEFATGGPSLDLAFPPAKNPWDSAAFTGGSSSGSAVAVAAGLTRLALGSDTGGSIRGPAHYCGTVGLKPTYGLISKRGIYPLAYSLDHAGTLSASVQDSAIALNVLAGHDSQDVASANVPSADYTALIGRDISGVRIGYARTFFASAEGLSPEVPSALDAAAAQFAALGADVSEVEMPDYAWFDAAGRLTLQAEAHAIHQPNLRARPTDYARFTYLRLMSGVCVTSADYINAQRVRRALTDQIEADIFSRCDVILTVAVLEAAPDISSFSPDRPPKQATRTIPFNLTGHPAITVPAGFSKNNRPIGLQLAAPAFQEAKLLQVAAAFEAATPWAAKRPSLFAR